MARKIFPIVTLTVLFAILFSIFYDRDTFEPESIRGKRVLVTGSSSGIGEQIAYQYSTMGASVMLTARRRELLMKVASKCKELGATKVEYVVADMRLPEDRTRLVKETEKQLGGLDHLILNHAVIECFLWTGSAKNMTSLEETFNINFMSYVDLASKCHRMLAVSKGNIGVVSSGYAKISSAFFHLYSASKHALHGFFVGYREELKHVGSGISVTLCVLGTIDNERSNIIINTVFPDNKLTPSTINAPSSNETALEIIKGVSKRAYEIRFPFELSVTLIMHKIIPHYIEERFSLSFYAGI